MKDFILNNFDEDGDELRFIIEECECNFPYDEDDSTRHKELYNKCKKLDIKFSQVEQYGGEGQGDQYYYVFKVEHNNESCLFRLDGWYASYNGHEFDSYRDFKEVKAVEKTVIVYE